METKWEIKTENLKYQLLKNGQKYMGLTGTEAQVIQLFLDNPDTVFSVQDIAEKTGGKADYIYNVIRKFEQISDLPIGKVRGWVWKNN